MQQTGQQTGQSWDDMQGGRAQAAQLVFVVLLLAVIAFAALARKLRLPYPIVLVLAGLVVSFLPGLPGSRSTPTSSSTWCCLRCSTRRRG